MSFDTSRFTFDPRKNYTGVVMEQGRVQLDSDWNEWLAQLSRRTAAETLDLVGRAAYPATTPSAFQINVASDGSNQISIGPGRMYVDGLLAENHGDPATSTWDPALAEISGSPQPPPPAGAGAATGSIDYLKQPSLPGAALPADLTKPYLAYLDVWQRAVTYIEDPHLIDPAVGIDTTGRLQTVWQVKLAPVAPGVTCANAGNPWAADSAGLLTVGTSPSAPSGPCCLSDGTGFTGLENQNYRIEIHQPGPVSAATFKWSRDNASVETVVSGILSVTNSLGAAASQLTVNSMGRDHVLGFAPGNWIEILDDDLELLGVPGELHQIDTIDFSARTITLDSPVSATSFPVDGSNQPDSGRHNRIRRWDQSGKIFESDGTTVFADLGAAASTGDIPVPPAGTSLILENGIIVSFSLSSATGAFNTGDFWTAAARTSDGSIEQLTAAPPRGIHHHYASLAIVTFSPPGATDCRVAWPPASGQDSCGCCCSVTVGDGIESVGKYTSINAALAALPASGGEVCILPGRYFEHVLIQGLHDVVLHGCGFHTRLASPSLAPGKGASTPKDSTKGAPEFTTFNAVVSISGSEHIQLRSFAVEADTDEVGVLIDGTGALIPPPPSNTGANPEALRAAAIKASRLQNDRGAIDISVNDLYLSASTRPALLAKRVNLLRVDDNRVAMEDVFSLWPAVYVSGTEIHLDRNWVGIQGAATLREWLPTTVVEDLTPAPESQPKPTEAPKAASHPAPGIAAKAGKKPAAQPATTEPAQVRSSITDTLAPAFSVATPRIAKHPGGIQVAGPSRRVYLVENLIEGGRFNGITLGSYIILDENGGDTNQTVGITITHGDPCSTTGTLQTPGDPGGPGSTGQTLVAGEPLIDILIRENRITGMGLCGIGPVGFFDLRRTLEIITIENLTITANTIKDTLLLPTSPISVFGPDTSSTATGAAGPTSSVGTINTSSSMPYGAICIPTVENLVIRDNAITNFGAQPGVKANGIFVLNGEMLEISRNQILETRDWTAPASDTPLAAAGIHGGIVIAVVTPPTLPPAAKAGPGSRFLFEPGLPALRVEENVVRVPLGQAFVAFGFGPFAISDNHFTCGGTLRGRGTPFAQTVLILNLGAAIEAEPIYRPSGTYSNGLSGYSKLNDPGSVSQLTASSNGTVLFTDNICELESRADRQRSFTSVTIFSTDHLTFSNNHCWLDTITIDAVVDALLIAGTLTVTGNRFQESPVSVLLSAWTAGAANITSQNISTFCLLAEGAMLVNNNNLALANAKNPDFCAGLLRR